MSDCLSCKESRAPQPVDFQTHQADMARMERSNKRLWILCIVLALMLFGFFIYESQVETVTETTTESYEASVDGDGTAFNNRSGEVLYGGKG